MRGFWNARTTHEPPDALVERRIEWDIDLKLDDKIELTLGYSTLLDGLASGHVMHIAKGKEDYEPRELCDDFGWHEGTLNALYAVQDHDFLRAQIACEQCKELFIYYADHAKAIHLIHEEHIHMARKQEQDRAKR